MVASAAEVDEASGVPHGHARRAGIFGWVAVAALLGASLFIGWISTERWPVREGIEAMKASPPSASSSAPSKNAPPAKKKPSKKSAP